MFHVKHFNVARALYLRYFRQHMAMWFRGHCLYFYSKNRFYNHSAQKFQFFLAFALFHVKQCKKLVQKQYRLPHPSLFNVERHPTITTFLLVFVILQAFSRIFTIKLMFHVKHWKSQTFLNIYIRHIDFNH